MSQPPIKILGQKAYGSIPHLFGSRRGVGDHGINERQSSLLTERVRDKYDEVIVTEKLDGSNVAVCRLNDIIYPLTRSGYSAFSSPYEMHHIFGKWVLANQMRFRAVLLEGARICGEWLYQAHGTVYNLPHEPFVVFDMFEPKSNKRLRYSDLLCWCNIGRFEMPKLLHRGGSLHVEDALSLLGEYGHHGALSPDKAEGVVYRIERKGQVDFLAKYVRHDKVDGKYLVKGAEPIINNFPNKEKFLEKLF